MRIDQKSIGFNWQEGAFGFLVLPGTNTRTPASWEVNAVRINAGAIEYWNGTDWTATAGGGSSAMTGKAIEPGDDYTVNADDNFLVLKQNAGSNHVLLPSATENSRPVKIFNQSTTPASWILTGTFVQMGTSGSLFINSGLAAGELYHLHPILDNGIWKWYNLV